MESIYCNAGQYDKFCLFHFAPQSSAYSKYGSSVNGIIIYQPSERKMLHEYIEVKFEDLPRTDGRIKLSTPKGTANEGLLLSEGFLVSDIASLDTFIDSGSDSYSDKSHDRPIPNTINIDVDFSDDDGISLETYVLEMRHKDEMFTPLIPYELTRLYALRYLRNKKSVGNFELFKYLIDRNTRTFYETAHYLLLHHKYKAFKAMGRDMPKDEIQILLHLIRTRNTKRFKIICKHLGISQKQLDLYKQENEDGYLEIQKLVRQFNDETLVTKGGTIPIHWDFERCMHIMFRHYKNFSLDVSTKGQGTSFQYSYRDIRRLIEIVLTDNLAEIETYLKKGRTYKKYSGMGYYYDGNYYNFTIDSNGKLMQFHPQD
jgi:hypothetical protein